MIVEQLYDDLGANTVFDFIGLDQHNLDENKDWDAIMQLPVQVIDCKSNVILIYV